MIDDKKQKEDEGEDEDNEDDVQMTINMDSISTQRNTCFLSDFEDGTSLINSPVNLVTTPAMILFVLIKSLISG